MSLIQLQPSQPVARRGFLVRLSQTAAALTAAFSDPARLGAASPSPAFSSNSAAPDAWIDGLKGEYKVMLHVHQYFMTGLVDARTMLANARDAYGVPEAQHGIAVMTHGPAIQGLLGDNVWQRFALGAFYKVNDPKTGAPATRNMHLAPQEGEPIDAVVPDLMQRGVTFVVCNVALRTLAKRLAPAGISADALHGELVAGLVPGTFLVPDLFVSIARAQKRGVAYLYTDRSR